MEHLPGGADRLYRPFLDVSNTPSQQPRQLRIGETALILLVSNCFRIVF